MRTQRKSVTAAAVILVGSGLGGVAAHIASAQVSSPPRPPWVRPDGTVHASKMPARVPVVDASGQLVADANGKLVMVPTGFDNPGPPPIQTAAAVAVPAASGVAAPRLEEVVDVPATRPSIP